MDKNDLLNCMTLYLDDIVKQQVDAIVNAVPANMKVQGTLDAAIRLAAGDDYGTYLLSELPKLKSGDVFLLPGFKLPCQHIILTAADLWHGGWDGEDHHLIHCYTRSLKLANKHKLKRIAYPALATGRHGFPPVRAARLAIRAMIDHIEDHEFDEIRFVVNNPDMAEIYLDRLRKHGWNGELITPP